MEQELSSGLSERQIAELVENDEVHSRELISDPTLPSIAGLDLEPVDEVDHVVEPATGPGADAASGDGDGQMGLAGAGQDSITMPGVRRSRSGSAIRFILDTAKWCRSRSGGGSQARITDRDSARRHAGSGPVLDGGANGWLCHSYHVPSIIG